MGGGVKRPGNIRNDVSGEWPGQTKTHSDGQAGNRETSASCRQTSKANGTIRESEQLWQISLQLLRHQPQTADQDCVRLVSRKSGFREHNQGTEV